MRFCMSKTMTPSELALPEKDLRAYCTPDTLAVIKKLKKLYEAVK